MTDSTQGTTASPSGGASVRTNEQVVEAFLQDVINGHNGDHVANYLNPDMQWSGGTVGTVTGSANVPIRARFSASPPAGAMSSGTASMSTA